MARIIPGVEVSVIKEVVPKQLTPTGILALVGVTEKGPETNPYKPKHVSAWKDFVEEYGRSVHTMPEAKQAFQNGVFELVVARVDGGTKASYNLKKGATNVVKLEARGEGIWANNEISAKVESGSKPETVKVMINYNGKTESFDNLVMNPYDENRRYLVDVINNESANVAATDLYQGKHLPATKETKQSLSGGQNAVDAAPAVASSITLPSEANKTINVIKLAAKSPGIGGNSLKIKLSKGTDPNTVTLEVYEGTNATPTETFANKTMAGDAKDLVTAINAVGAGAGGSSLISAEDMIPAAGLPDAMTAFENLAGGATPTTTTYNDALTKLASDATIDSVMACISYPLPADNSNYDKEIHVLVEAHCNLMSNEAKNRIGFASAPPPGAGYVDTILGKKNVFNSDRFIFIAPHGVAGAVAGMIGKLDYYQSPTFKTLSGISELEYDLNTSDLQKLLLGNVLPVDLEEGKGVIVIKGITTSAEQISVTRIADHAVRGTKSIADLFIGKLNTEDGRMSLKQKIVEFFRQMEKENAIVPSTDGKEPAFKVDVYSSQRDFALGIVRVDIAVRPVRAIDYIYATILVEV